MRAWHVLMLIGFTTGAACSAIAHVPTLEECLEGGDFIAHAAQSRDNGMTKEQFMERLVGDIRLIQSYPPQLRWFVADADDATFLHEEASRVFDARRPPDAHRSQFLSRCFDRSAGLVSEQP